jgi:hypothetical protein
MGLTLVDIDLGTLIQKRIKELGKTVADVSVAVYGNPKQLTGALNRGYGFTAPAFCKLVRELEVAGNRMRLKHWLAGFLMSINGPPEMLRLLDIGGLLEGESEVDHTDEEEQFEIAAKNYSRDYVADHKGWHLFSLNMDSGVNRYIFCRVLYDEGPTGSGLINKRLGLFDRAANHIGQDLVEKGFVSLTKEASTYLCANTKRRACAAYTWSLTPKGRAAIEKAETCRALDIPSASERFLEREKARRAARKQVQG